MTNKAHLFSDSRGEIGVVVGGDFNPVIVVVDGSVLVVEDAPVAVDPRVNEKGFDLEVAVETLHGPRTVTAGPALVTGVGCLARRYILKAAQGK